MSERATDEPGVDISKDSAPVPARPARGSGRRWLPLAGLAIVALVAVALLVVQTLRIGGRDADVDERRDVSAAASAVAEAILSYDYTDIEGTLDRVEAHIGGEFAEIYDETFRSVQVPVIVQLQAVATAEVRDIYVTEISDGSAHAVVLIDQTVQSTAGLRSLTGTFLQMDLVERDGRWVVESIPLRISSQNETLTPIPGAEDPAATTTTTTTTATPP